MQAEFFREADLVAFLNEPDLQVWLPLNQADFLWSKYFVGLSQSAFESETRE